MSYQDIIYDKLLQRIKSTYSENEIVAILIAKYRQGQILLKEVQDEKDLLEEELKKAQSQIKQYENNQKHHNQTKEKIKIVTEKNTILYKEIDQKNEEIRQLLSKLY